MTSAHRQSSPRSIVLIISCAHAMVHLIEQSFASVEQIVSTEFGLSTIQSGALGSALRIPFGFGAVFTGILADRVGPARVLILYLGASAVLCGLFPVVSSPDELRWLLLLLGVFASMYHPAGLAMLSTVSVPEHRGRALGIHGVFGSLGLAAAPILAGLVLLVPGSEWRHFFVLLAGISAVLTVAFAMVTSHWHGGGAAPISRVDDPPDPSPTSLRVVPFAVLMISSACSGIVYGGFLHFLKRYLSEIDWPESISISRDSLAGALSGLVLFCGVAGQWISGALAKPSRLPGMLTLIYLADVPMLLWMSMATGPLSLLPCCLLGLIHFMNQPVYNSLLPEYTPVRTRSTWFGVSQMMTFGIGALGPSLAGSFSNYRDSYRALAAISFFAGLLPAFIWLERRRRVQR